MNAARARVVALVLAAAAAGTTAARDRPGTPNGVAAQAKGPTAVALSWRNTGRGDQLLRFEVEATRDGLPLRVAQPEGSSGTGQAQAREHGHLVSGLAPEARHCFRLWSRLDDNQVRSAIPSSWACADTPAVPPLAPLDVVATLSLDRTRARVDWKTPDQTGHRRVTRFEVERQSPPGPGRPVLREGSVAGPDGAQTPTTRLAFSLTTAVLDPSVPHQLRVCAVNSGGRTCAKPVVAIESSINVHKGGGSPLPRPPDDKRPVNLRQAAAPPAVAAPPLKSSAAMTPSLSMPGEAARAKALPAAASAPAWRALPAPMPPSGLQRHGSVLP
jgi:hypothetical protein